MSNRIDKVNNLLREKLSQIIREELSLKNTILVTIIKVDTSRDLRYAKAFLSVYPENEKGYALKTLQKESKKIHKVLHQELYMKPLPKIRFIVDETQENVSEIEDLFEKIKQEREEK